MSIVGIVTGLAFEARIVEDALRALPPEQRPFVSCRGLGRAAAQAAAHDLLARGVSALMSFGVAAGTSSAVQLVMVCAGSPASAVVGTSAMSGWRV